MNFINRITIRKKILFGFFAVILAFLLMSPLYIISLLKNGKRVNEIDAFILKYTLRFVEIQKDIIQIQHWLTDVSATRAEKGFDDGFEMAHLFFEKAIKNIDKSINDYKETTVVSNLQEIKNELIDYYYFGIKVANAYIAGGQALGNPLMKKFNPYAEKLNSNIEILVTEQKITLENNVSILRDNLNQLIVILAVCLVISLIIGVLFAILFSQSISKIINILVSTIHDIVTNKDMTINIKVKTKDELFILVDNLNILFSFFDDIFSVLKSITRNSRETGMKLSNLAFETAVNAEKISKTLFSNKKVVHNLNNEINSCVSAVNQIVTSINNITSLVQNQSSAVTNSSGSIDEIVAAIKNITSIVNTKKEISMQLSDTAQDGLDKMEKSIEAVNKISASTDNIFEMIEMINSIAGQTDLLSMNAAIEAAHAGEAGRGFAVVADEIRKLSDQTREYAQQIDIILKRTVTDIGEAIEINKISGNAFHSIVNGINGIADGMEETSSGMNELLSGSNEILNALSSLVRITGQIKNSTIAINKSADSINKNMIHVSEISTQTLSSIDKVTGSSNDISEAMNSLSEIGGENSNNIKIMDMKLNQFKTKKYRNG